MIYHLILENGYIVAVTTKQTKGATGAVFTKEYLDRFGIHTEGKEYFDVHHPFVRFKYLESDAAIATEEREEEVAKVTDGLRRADTHSSIVSGFKLEVAGTNRVYDCEIEDQLAIIQALHLARTGSAEIKCTVDGKKAFVSHTQVQCDEVMTAMSNHILALRKGYASKG